MKFHILTLGCPKNQVDSEGMAQLLIDAGHEPAADPGQADALIVNTCGFIEQAREESLEHLRRLAALKRRTRGGAANGGGAGRRNGKLLIAAGCLGQRYERELLARVPELDGILGTLRWGEIAGLLAATAGESRPCWTGEPGIEAGPTRFSKTSQLQPSAYLKIADGCDAVCAFCAIPGIKGPQRSKPAADVLAEARTLAAQGVKEIVLVAQDTTAYGRDRGDRDGLADLLDRLVAEVPEAPWLRVMYAYPAHISDRLLEVMARHRQIVKYLDLPLQHANADVLRRMRRPLNGRQVVARIREAVPGIALRSAFIVGFPGETESEFRDLLSFLEEAQFDRVGIFTYSREDGTAAAELEPQVPQKVKRTRYKRAMELQQRISLARNRALVGREIEVLVEGGAPHGEAGQLYGAVGRSYRDAPEVDGLVLISQALPPGTIATVRIVAALPYDVVGEAVTSRDADV